MAYQATGKAITAAIKTNFKKSFDNSVTICGTLAPNTLRTPISLTLCVMVKADNPNKPKQAIKIAMHENIVNKLLCCFSVRYS